MASSQPTVEVVLKNVCGILGEGPHWDDATQTLLFVDSDEYEMHRYNPSTGQHDVKKYDDILAHVIPRASGGYMMSLGRRLVEVHWDREEVKTVAEVEVGVLTNSFNDGKCDAKGRLWSGPSQRTKLHHHHHQSHHTMASSKPTVEVVLKNVCGLLGEGPHWDDATQTLLFVDSDEYEMHRYNPSTGQHDVKKYDDILAHVIPRASGGYMMSLGRRLVEVHWDREEVKTVAEVEVGVLTNSFNDGKCDAKGRLWSGTVGCMGKNSGEGFIQGAGTLYKLDLDHSISKHFGGLTLSNGLAWSGDNQTMYFVDSVPQNVYAFDFDLEAGTISNQRTVLTLPGDSGVNPAAIPDGMTIDTDGKLWIACWEGAAVIKLDPHTGKTLQKIDIPAGQVTSVCWGGENLDELYVTCANSSKDQLEKYPLAGSLFKVTGLGARGLPAYVYQG